MNRLALTFEVAVLILPFAAVQAEETYVPGEKPKGNFENFASSFMERHCFDCHDDETTKGDLNLLELGPVGETNAAVWKSVWSQVALQEMPPKKKSQPDVIDRLRFTDWIVSELQQEMKNKGGFYAHLDPQKANFVDHDLLFGPLPKGIRLSPTSSPARIWRVTPQEHITRLNEFINAEPEYDPAKPGLRTHGDVVPTNHGGELKLYFGTDRIIMTYPPGGGLTHSTALTSVPEVLSSARKHGLENYPDFYTVNSAEATQILSQAKKILQYMAYGPLSIANPEQITDDPATYDKVKPEGDIRGFPTAIVYSTKVVRPLTPILDLMKEPGVTDARLRAAVDYLFEGLTLRPPSAEESNDYLQITRDSIDKVGKEKGAFMGLSAIFLDPDALFRRELVESGVPDKLGRVMLQDWELGLAVNHALRYLKPEPALRKAIDEGRMRTRMDVKREVTRMLADDSIRKPRLLRFFRDFFDHDLGGYVCKDTISLAKAGPVVFAPPKLVGYYFAQFDAAASTDRLIELILQEDQDVLRELLTTDKVVVSWRDKVLFDRVSTPAEVDASVESFKQAAEKQAHQLEALEKEVPELEAHMKANPNHEKTKKLLETRNRQLAGARRTAEFYARHMERWRIWRFPKEAAEKQAHELESLEKEVAELEAHMKANPRDEKTKKILEKKNRQLPSTRKKLAELEGPPRPPYTFRVNHMVTTAEFSGPLVDKKIGRGRKIYARAGRRSFGNGSLGPDRILSTAPEGQRKGILTQPSWLVSHSDAMDNHAILRGRWIRERLLGGGIPDVPITVDAMLPDEPHNTLRERMRVTREKYCWTCHEKMDPLGMPFEMYNHAGLFRTLEQEKPVDTSGEIIDSGDPALDGPVKNALEMIEKLAKSERVEQVFVRHAFRFWMGRNETLNDAPVLQAAHKAYRESGGSMKALITSLLTSDAFLYRKVETRLARN